MDRPRFWRLANSQDWCHCAHFTFSERDYFYQEFPFDYTIRNLFCTHTETDIFFSMNAFERRFCSVTKQARCQLLQSPRDGKNRNKSRKKYLQNVVWQQSGFRLYFLGKNRILLFSAFLRAWIKWPENCCLFLFWNRSVFSFHQLVQSTHTGLLPKPLFCVFPKIYCSNTPDKRGWKFAWMYQTMAVPPFN